MTQSKLTTYFEVMVAAAIVILLSKDNESLGYAERTLMFYNVSPLGEVEHAALAFDLGYFLGLEEEVQLNAHDKRIAGSSPLSVAFNDLLNEVASWLGDHYYGSRWLTPRLGQVVANRVWRQDNE